MKRLKPNRTIAAHFQDDAQMAFLKDAARRAGMTPSAFLREAGLKLAEQVKCECHACHARATG